MSLVTGKRQRIALCATTLVLLSLMLVGATSSTASQQVTATPTSGTPVAKAIFLTDAVPDPKQAGVLWFAPTGHTLRGAFLDYWQKNGGLAQFGYPLTEEFFEEVGADKKLLQVQYFERNRFELHPENAGTQYEVLLGTLGLDFHKMDPSKQQQPDAQYFSETGHNLSGKFLEYWQSHGGLAVQGYPVTEAQMEKSTNGNGKEYMVQWFERSKLELHPENAGSPYEVLLGALGRQLSEKQGYPYGWYPRYGYAVDYSWVAGKLLPPRYCVAPVCDCTLVAYGDPNELIRPWGDGWTTAQANGTAKSTYVLIMFGQRQSNAEQDPTCKPNFKVDRVQLNPSDVVPR